MAMLGYRWDAGERMDTAALLTGAVFCLTAQRDRHVKTILDTTQIAHFEAADTHIQLHKHTAFNFDSPNQTIG